MAKIHFGDEEIDATAFLEKLSGFIRGDFEEAILGAAQTLDEALDSEDVDVKLDALDGALEALVLALEFCVPGDDEEEAA